jgi:hypothetical protein
VSIQDIREYLIYRFQDAGRHDAILDLLLFSRNKNQYCAWKDRYAPQTSHHLLTDGIDRVKIQQISSWLESFRPPAPKEEERERKKRTKQDASSDSDSHSVSSSDASIATSDSDFQSPDRKNRRFRRRQLQKHRHHRRTRCLPPLPFQLATASSQTLQSYTPPYPPNGSSTPALLLYSPTTTYKSALIDSLAREKGFSILELSPASSRRSGADIVALVGESTQSLNVWETTAGSRRTGPSDRFFNEGAAKKNHGSSNGIELCSNQNTLLVTKPVPVAMKKSGPMDAFLSKKKKSDMAMAKKQGGPMDIFLKGATATKKTTTEKNDVDMCLKGAAASKKTTTEKNDMDMFLKGAAASKKTAIEKNEKRTTQKGRGPMDAFLRKKNRPGKDAEVVKEEDLPKRRRPEEDNVPTIPTECGKKENAVIVNVTTDVEEPVIVMKSPKRARLSLDAFLGQPARRKTSGPSLLVLDDVDLLYAEDVGFWRAVMKLIMDTRRPIVLTCNGTHIDTFFSPFSFLIYIILSYE